MPASIAEMPVHENPPRLRRPDSSAPPHVPFDESVRDALDLAVRALFLKQHADGHWCAELEGDSILITEYLLMKWILGQAAAPEATERDRARFEKMLVYLRRLQRADGTWGQYPGSPADLSACVKAYFTLKLFGDDPASPHMERARERIRAMGGAERINTFSMFYLACLGQVSWDACPAIPPEIVFLPRWFPFHLDKVAAWTRTMILPLAICTATRPVRRVPGALGIDELFVDPSRRNRLNQEWDAKEPVGWKNFFLGVDRALKRLQRSGVIVTRAAAIRAAEAWILDRMRPETTDGLGAIFPPMVYVQIALQSLGYPRSHPVIVNAEKELDRFIVEPPGEDHARIQPCFSPVWDTGIALYALTEAGLTIGNDPRIARTCEWLCEREVSMVGDWINNLRHGDRRMRMGPGPGESTKLGAHSTDSNTEEHARGGAWAFEYRNDWYPDNDDTVMVCKAMWRAASGVARYSLSGRAQPVQGARHGVPGHLNQRARAAALRGIRWVLAMQNDDGGWAAFDRTKDRPWMELVPFADHNAMQDPSCADITGRTLEALVTCGVPREHEAVRRAVAYLRKQQREQGCWWGRWGCNFIYGTWQAVGGLISAGEDPRTPYLQQTLAWLRSIQNDDGGFGETANSYLDESIWMGKGPSTASQTAWGACAMMFLVGADDEHVRRAIEYLLKTQLREDAPAEPWAGDARRDPPGHILPEPAGSWREEWFTGTGFPKVFYLRYHLYRHYFPVMALARYMNLSRDMR